MTAVKGLAPGILVEPSKVPYHHPTQFEILTLISPTTKIDLHKKDFGLGGGIST